MDEIYTYIIKLPAGVDEVVLPCADGYTIYLADRLDSETRAKRYAHALTHIIHRDFDSGEDVQEIEHQAHRRENHD